MSSRTFYPVAADARLAQRWATISAELSLLVNGDPYSHDGFAEAFEAKTRLDTLNGELRTLLGDATDVFRKLGERSPWWRDAMVLHTRAKAASQARQVAMGEMRRAEKDEINRANRSIVHFFVDVAQEVLDQPTRDRIWEEAKRRMASR